MEYNPLERFKMRKYLAKQTYYIGGEPFVTGGRTYHEAVKWVFYKGKSKAYPTGYVIDDSETVWEIGTPEFKRMFIEV